MGSIISTVTNRLNNYIYPKKSIIRMLNYISYINDNERFTFNDMTYIDEYQLSLIITCCIIYSDLDTLDYLMNVNNLNIWEVYDCLQKHIDSCNLQTLKYLIPILINHPDIKHSACHLAIRLFEKRTYEKWLVILYHYPYYDNLINSFIRDLKLRNDLEWIPKFKEIKLPDKYYLFYPSK